MLRNMKLELNIIGLSHKIASTYCISGSPCDNIDELGTAPQSIVAVIHKNKM
jgi:hypothetical protein